jgi:hypothetical protein
MARFHGRIASNRETWSSAPIWGHAQNNPIMPITEQDANDLRRAGIHTIGQIYDAGDGIQIDSHMPIRLKPAGIDNRVWDKVIQVHRGIARQTIQRGGKSIAENGLHTLRRVGTFSHIYRKFYKDSLALDIKAPPSFYTRRRDGLPVPSLDAYCKAYTQVLTSSNATTAAITFSFAALNRTVWTAKKQAQSGNAGGRRQEEGIDTGTCTLCARVEDTAHILTDCNAYSYRLWERFGELLTATHRKVNPDAPRVSLTFSNIMYHTPILSLPVDQTKKICAVIMEIKRDIYVRRTDRCIAGEGRGGGRLYTDQRLDMHVSIACHRVMKIIESKGKEPGIVDELRRTCIEG